MNAGAKSGAVHERFSWLHKSLEFDREAQFTATASDVCKGIVLVLELVHTSNLDRSNNEQCDPGAASHPTLGVIDTERLFLFAQAAARMLAADAERNIDRMNKSALASERTKP